MTSPARDAAMLRCRCGSLTRPPRTIKAGSFVRDVILKCGRKIPVAPHFTLRTETYSVEIPNGRSPFRQLTSGVKREPENRTRSPALPQARPWQGEEQPGQVHQPRRDDRQEGEGLRQHPAAANPAPPVPLRPKGLRRRRPRGGRPRYAPRTPP